MFVHLLSMILHVSSAIMNPCSSCGKSQRKKNGQRKSRGRHRARASAVDMKFRSARSPAQVMMGIAFAAALAVSACGAAASNPTTQATVTVTVTATASPNPSLTSSAAAPSPAAATSSSSSSSSPSSSTATEGSYYLSGLNAVQGHGINVDTAPRTVNGVTYDHPVSWSPGFSGDPYWAEWDLSRQCTSLTVAGAGLADDAPSDAIAIFSVQADGVYRWQKTISFGQSDSVNVSIKGALRLRLTVTDRQNSVGSNATWGDAQITCSKQPPNSAS
jgi:hypothetical protein